MGRVAQQDKTVVMGEGFTVLGICTEIHTFILMWLLIAMFF